MIEALDASIRAARHALETGDDQGVRDALTDFSDHLASATDNGHLRRVLKELRNKVMLIGNTTARLPGRHARSIEEHQRIVDAIRAGDPAEAGRATVDHVRSIERAWLETAAAKDGPGSTRAPWAPLPDLP